MSDSTSQPTTPTPAPGVTAPPAQAADPTPPPAPLVKSGEVDWKAEARKWETRSKENAEAAKKLAEIEDANKTEAQRVADRLADTEKRATEAEARAARREVALKHRLSPEDAALLDNITDESAMKALAERLADESGKRRNHVPGEGSNPRPAEDKDAVARAFFGIT